jgi:hypothetical protein
VEAVNLGPFGTPRQARKYLYQDGIRASPLGVPSKLSPKKRKDARNEWESGHLECLKGKKKKHNQNFFLLLLLYYFSIIVFILLVFIVLGIFFFSHSFHLGSFIHGLIWGTPFLLFPLPYKAIPPASTLL